MLENVENAAVSGCMCAVLCCNPAEAVASLGRVVAQESDHDSDSADSIYLTDSEEEAEQFQGK